jgi:hypothetical protein|tara:strand:+ start:827 stop:1426 length:600 start_codon:yes stop_codon:yes gene_type:complete
MAYPTVSAPYGLKPVNLIGGQVFAGATRKFKIASGYAANLLYGDVVKIINDGTIEKDTGTATATPVGVFLGVSYTDPGQNQPIWKQYWPTGTVASDAMAFVCDDPDQLFRVAVTAAGSSTISSVARTAIGNNSALIQGTGSTITGDSAVSISATTATTNTLPIRIIDIVPDTATAADTYVEVIVKWNFGMHQYERALGV